ncbi:2-dehydropantoate 2-reductase [Novosphingobium sp. RD2P27]|uniref:2-dehydropantoate 2-reductase n=1 Tax=Novosphingobium kalidii TaxID=3230299 RepID=A0ABV2D1I9_9SPHN
MTAPMRIAVAGVGAVGAVVAYRLAAAGNHVTLVARGQRAEQLRSTGLQLARLPAIAADVVGAAELPEQDAIFLAVKEQGLAPLLEELAAAIAAETLVIPLVNGIPFWMLADHACPGELVGAAVYVVSRLDAAGVAHPTPNARLTLGLPHGASIPRLDALAAMLTTGGIVTKVSADIRADIWAKMALNLATNPLSVVSGATLHDQFHDPALNLIVRAMLEEAVSAGQALGVASAMTVDAMMDVGRAVGPVETSMLQDYKAGRPLELEAIALRCLNLAESRGMSMPVANTVVSLAGFAGRQASSNIQG